MIDTRDRELPVARLHCRWKPEGGVLAHDGYRCESGHMEIDNAKPRCSISSQSPAVTAPR